MACNCEGKKYNIGMGCCQPVLGPIENYYTKYQIDDMLEEIESAITSGCCITPEEVDEKIDEAVSGKQDTLSAGTNIIISGNVISASGCDLTDYYTKEQVDAKIPSLNGYATEQWVLDKHYITGVDLSDYATKQWVEDKHYITGVDLSNYATEQWVINQNYIDNSEFIQYITNLQNQIDSLKAQISGCCSQTGTSITRWITMTGENDYTCSGTTKMTKEKEQTSADGGNTWIDTGNYRTGSTVLEVNSLDCGYVPPSKFYAEYSDTTDYNIYCDGNSNLEQTDVRAHTTSYRQMTEAEIGSCVTTIGAHAFIDCTGLTSVTIPSSVTTIKEDAFMNCTNLYSLSVPNSVTTLGYGAFSDCRNMRTANIPNNLVVIPESLFESNTSLSSITIPNSVISIGTAAFGFCYSLSSVTVPSNVTTINDNVFWHCSGLTSVSFGNDSLYLGEGVFQGCTSLTNIVLPKNMTVIKAKLFNGCTSLASITIPSGVTTIEGSAFNHCTSLSSITIPSGVTAIYSAFEECSGLTSITCLATTPPTLSTYTFYRTNDCPIYVPATSVEAYKAADGWKGYKSRIQAIP